jgi:LEA14-like dessication related protein
MKINQLAILLSCISFLFVASCSKPLQPEYRGFDQVQISKIGANESVVSAKVKFYNPNNFPLQLKQADINLLLNDKQVAHSHLDSTINIPKLDSFYVPVSFSVKFANIFGSALLSLLSSKAKLNADGFIRIRKSGFAFSVPVHYENYLSYSDIDSLLQNMH